MNKKIDSFDLIVNENAAEPLIIKGKNYRITLLTNRLIRMEYDPEGFFEDRKTQVVWNRKLDYTEYKIVDKTEELCIFNDYLELHYTKKEFTKNSLWIDIKGAYSNHDSTWHYGEEAKDLRGTCRTLDKINGSVELEHGLCARNGYSILDDSDSLLLNEYGEIELRRKECIDIYYFGYGHDYQGCIRDFYRLTGRPPMLPRYAFGNWWSRYYAYSESEYKQLMMRFIEEKIPFSVAVLDMDWHITNVPEKYGRGWTGYTWNKDLFPDPEGFMEWLHKLKLKVSLNLHPADGVRAHEDIYVPMAKALGVDYEKEESIPFDLSDEKFMDAYFKFLHHPLEKQGVDFWWIDWQSGGVSKLEGLDPLWMLNHFHSLDIGRNGKRSMIFSRYAGPGSHRYPVGFSGDTYITWASLNFQPYFTANSSNIGYLFWSHDIGGHMCGIRDDELAARWVQFGVFSPINRLHSSDSAFSGKEPWKYSRESEHSMKKMLRLRHRIIPYLYSMNYEAYKKLVPLIQPMYYTHPEKAKSYDVPNQYWLGSEFIVHPITSPNNKKTLRGKVNAWLPEGQWVDLFNGMVYSGEKEITLHRKLDELPVLAKAGAIVPMAVLSEKNNTDNPEALEILCIPGANGRFTLYEDEGDNQNYKEGKYALTSIRTSWDESVKINIDLSGDMSVLPQQRNYTVLLRGCRAVEAEKIKVYVAGEEKSVLKMYDNSSHTIQILIGTVSIYEKIEVIIQENNIVSTNEDIIDRIFMFLQEAQIEYDLKEKIFYIISTGKNIKSMISGILSIKCDEEIKSVIIEYLTAY